MGVIFHSAAAWGAQLMALLPRGRAWPRDPGSVLARLMAAFGDELARIEARAAGLIDEADPLATLELLPDWERLAGLPDDCAPIAGPIRDRQAAVARKIAGTGGQSIAYLTEIAARIGVIIAITEFAPFTTESGCDAEICDDGWRFAFTVTVLPNSAILTEAGAYQDGWLTADSGCDEALRSFGIDSLECLINRAKPAHSIALFAYPDEPEPILWFDHLSNQGVH